MAWMIGIDEAGYGPNLGPLVVAATAWRVAEEETGNRGQGTGIGGRGLLAPSAKTVAPPIDLYTRLAGAVSTVPTDNRLAIADSKTLYKPGGGLRLLERAVLPALDAACWQEAFHRADAAGHRFNLPWYADYDCPLPVDADRTVLEELNAKFCAECDAAEVELVDVRARTVFPREFNELTDYHGTKGAALSHASIGLLREVVDRVAEFSGSSSTWPSALTDDVFVTCDKHGGRNRYAALLQHHFPDEWIETIGESRTASRYAWGPPDGRIEVCFRTKGEAELPTALASMTAKYHRELAMRAFNIYWTGQLAGLRHTAGYPVDAKRFKAEIASKQEALGIDDCDLWRNR